MELFAEVVIGCVLVVGGTAGGAVGSARQCSGCWELWSCLPVYYLWWPCFLYLRENTMSVQDKWSSCIFKEMGGGRLFTALDKSHSYFLKNFEEKKNVSEARSMFYDAAFSFSMSLIRSLQL